MPTFTQPTSVAPGDLVFGGNLNVLLPAWEEIPAEFKSENKWTQIVSDWFFYGLKKPRFDAKPGIDAKAAIQHLQAVLKNWGCAHEHKTAGVAYLMSLWFNDISYERASS